MLPVIDLFAGAGGLSIGASLAGADVRLLVDLDDIACQTARLNADWHNGAEVVCASVIDLTGQTLRSLAKLGPSDPLILIGGAPCQPFSKAAYWTEAGDESRFRRARARGEINPRPAPPSEPRADARRDLVQEFWRLVLESDADAFVLENVPSILHPRNRPVVEGILRAAKRQGFETRVVEADATEYGVAQKRQRVFILGARGARPREPHKTHASAPSAGSRLKPFVTAGEALAPFGSKAFFEPEEVVAGRWARHLLEIPPGWNYKFHSAWAGHPQPTFEAETRFWNFLLKLNPAKPSWTIPAVPGPWVGPFHWEGRRLRTPELAALQGFPEGYEFVGSRRDRVRQIGNAVPPPMAQRMVEAVLSAEGLN